MTRKGAIAHMVLGVVIGIVVVGCGQVSGYGQGDMSGGTGNGTATAGTAGSEAATMTPGFSGQTTSGQVTLTLNKTQYGAEDPVIVTVHNGLSQSIWLGDSRTGCPSVVLERQVNGQWQRVSKCAPATKLRSVAIAAGAQVVVRVDAAAGMDTGAGWPAGTYRATLSYATDQKTDSAQTSAQSTQLTIA
jgi:hypothetical protein